MSGPHPKPSEADACLVPLDAVVVRAMSLDPNARPQQADELARALRKYLSGVDLGDVARQLGDRVCRARANPPPPSAEQRPLLQRPPSRPTGMQVQTKTFALREEVLSGAAPSTRKLASSVPPPATRPQSFRHRGVALIAVGGVVGISLLAFLFGRGAASAPKPAAPSAATEARTVAAAPTVTVVAATTAASASGSSPLASSSAQAGADSASRAQLILLGDGTDVTVDGKARGRAPLRLALEPGAHSVRFTFPATRESKEVSLDLRATEQTTVRADFTGAQPTVRVQR